MIEIEIRKFMTSKLECPIVFELAPKMPDKFVLIQKTGSSKRNNLLASTFAFQSYGKSMYEASLLNETVKDIVEQLVELNNVSDVSLNSDYNYTDTESKKYRYQAVFDIRHY